jgi:hypothetical protein
MSRLLRSFRHSARSILSGKLSSEKREKYITRILTKLQESQNHPNLSDETKQNLNYIMMDDLKPKLLQVLNNLDDADLKYLNQKLKDYKKNPFNYRPITYVINAVTENIKSFSGLPNSTYYKQTPQNLLNTSLSIPSTSTNPISITYHAIPQNATKRQEFVRSMQAKTIHNEAARRAKTSASTVSGGSKRNHKRKSRKTKKSRKSKRSKTSKRTRRH